jgi:hypothetical protein
MSSRGVDDASSSSGLTREQASALLLHGSALLSSYQRHLLSLVADGVAASSAASSFKDAAVLARDSGASGALNVQLAGPHWVAGTAVSASPALRVLETYAGLLASHCAQILDVATSMAEAQVKLSCYVI